MIKLSSDQYRDLFVALTEAFDLFRLRMMLRFRLGKDLELETGGASGEEVFFNLIGKAERANWIPELLAGALADRTTPALQKIADSLRPQITAASVDHFNVTFVNNNLALVNRTVLRAALKQLTGSQPTDPRVLVVNGPPLSGKSYSVELISYLGRALKSFRFVWIDLKKISGEVRPEHLAHDIIDQMLLPKNIVPELEQEQDSRWVQTFCNRLQGVLGNAADQWWIVIDGFNHARLSPTVNDLVKELSGRRLTLPELRIVLLSYPDTLSPDVERVALREALSPVNERDLILFFSQVYKESNMTYFPRDIALRIGEVLRKADPKSSSFMEMLGPEVVKVAKEITT
jgi:hypothetical protein